MNKAVEEQPIRPAATVIIVRPAHPQYEILMLRRTQSAVFAGGMYVFPGGKIDDADQDPRLQPHLSELLPEQLHQRAALGDQWQACWVAGIRETFEEAGILLAYHAEGQMVSTEAAKLSAAREQLHQGQTDLLTFCIENQLTLALDQIHFFNRWVTPPGRPRRFDTRFFVAQAPTHQEHGHDGNETIDSVWISPREALSLNQQDRFGMMRVTIKQLETLDAYSSVDALMKMIKAQVTFEHRKPTLVGQ